MVSELHGCPCKPGHGTPPGGCSWQLLFDHYGLTTMVGDWITMVGPLHFDHCGLTSMIAPLWFDHLAHRQLLANVRG